MQGKTKSSSARRRAIIYVRVSRKGKRGGDSYITEKVQIETCEGWAKAKGMAVVATFTDVNRSGKNMDRPGFQEALAMLEAGEADTLIVARLTRFARSVKDAAIVLDEMEGWGASLVACDLDIDTRTPIGKLLRQLLSAFAEFELELAREKWVEAREAAEGRGVYLRKPPPGYRKNGGRELVVDEAVAPLVRELFVGRAAGVSWAELLRRWEEGGGPTITRNGLQTIIANREYLGSDRHDAIISVEQFDAAQVVKAPRPWRKRNGSLLAGFVTCSISGQPMTSGGEDKHGRKTYRCQPGPCKGHRQNISREHVDAYVEEELLAWAGELALEGTANGESGLIAAVQEREAAEAELAAFVTFSKAMDAKVFQLGLDARQARVDDAVAAEARIKSERQVENVRVRLAEVWPELDTEERRQLLTQAIERVEVHPSTHRGLGSYMPEEARAAAVRERLRVVFRKDV